MAGTTAAADEDCSIGAISEELRAAGGVAAGGSADGATLLGAASDAVVGGVAAGASLDAGGGLDGGMAPEAG